MQKKSLTITLDGPAASGKSTMGQRIAKTLNFIYLDTGVMYRAVTLAALNKNVDINDELMVTEVAETMDLEIQPPSIDDGRSNDILLAGEDVTWTIRLPDVEAHVSQVSAYKGVRTAMTKKQREIGAKGGVVMVGRDIGTVVLPDAEIKLYLDASVEERAKRRHLELVERGKDSDFDFVLEDLKRRDKIDSSREIAPLKPAEDAIIIDSDNLNIEQVFEHMMRIISEKI
jgi:cytidylate kinase